MGCIVAIRVHIGRLGTRATGAYRGMMAPCKNKQLYITSGVMQDP